MTFTVIELNLLGGMKGTCFSCMLLEKNLKMAKEMIFEYATEFIKACVKNTEWQNGTMASFL